MRVSGQRPWSADGRGLIGAAFGILLVAGMVEAAVLARLPQAIFPEYGALCAGILAFRAAPWRARLADAALFPFAAAVLGVGLDHVPVAFLVRWLAAIAGVLAMLWIARSVMVPSISAALLPLLFHYTGPVYPLAVLGSGLVLVLVAAADRRWVVKDRPVALPARPGRVTLAALSLVVVPWSVVAIALGRPLIMVPPIIVASLETIKAGRGDAWLRGAVLGASALVGVAVHLVVPWAVLDAVVAVAASAALQQLVRVPLPPAFALALLPLLFSTSAARTYGVLAAAGSMAVLLTAGLAVKVVASLAPGTGGRAATGAVAVADGAGARVAKDAADNPGTVRLVPVHTPSVRGSRK